MARQIQFVDAATLDGYGIKDYELFNEVREERLEAYERGNLKKPLSPFQVEIKKAVVSGHNQRKQWAIANREAVKAAGLKVAAVGNEEVGSISLFTGAVRMLPWMFHISECLFKESAIKKRFKRRYVDQGRFKAAGINQDELVKHEIVKDALYYAGEMLLWAKSRPGGSKPITKRQFFDRFKEIREVKSLSGHEKGIAGAIWNMWAKYYPDIRVSTKGGRIGAGKVEHPDPENGQS